MKPVLRYEKIYLVASRDVRSSEHRVTQREGAERPKTVRFTGSFPMETQDEGTYGTLVLTEKLWKEWFGEANFLPGFETAASAAETLVKRNANIYYGCPLCAYRSKSAGDAEEHIAAHVKKWSEQFTIEVVEEVEALPPAPKAKRTRRLNHQAQKLTPELFEEVSDDQTQ